MAELTELPQSSVPAAFDRGHLYSPNMSQARYALDDRYVYDYQPGTLFEPMPESPSGDPKAWAWWWKNVATEATPDFLGLRVGDEITIQDVTTVVPGTVLATCRSGARVRYPYPDPTKTGVMYVRRRNADGHWYP